jgi:hypothetical protein
MLSRAARSYGSSSGGRARRAATRAQWATSPSAAASFAAPKVAASGERQRRGRWS